MQQLKKRLHLILLLILTFNCASQKEAKIFVMDNEKVLTYEQAESLNNLVLNHEEKTTNEIAIITTPDWENHESALLFAVALSNKLGVGKEGKDNGVLIVFSKAMRETRINTGYGTEKVLTDEIAKKIIDSLMIPKFREELYYEGIYAGTKAVIDFLELPENIIK
ncbi:MAG: TPM domain-containing protein [Cytophagia bacterium]|nr:TPM domain-containing protein [Cytophagia bacterium]